MAVEPLPLAGRIDIEEEDIPKLRAEGWDYVPTNMPSTYREYWEMFHAIREFVQNSLDETETFDIRLTDEGLEIRDQGAGFFVADLLLHYREKPKWARGQFGEGLKIACIVCLRSGYPVYIWTTDKVIRPLFLRKRFIERGETHEARVVYFFWHPFPREKGTTVLLQGYRGELFLDRFVQKLPREAIVSTRRGTIKDHEYTDMMIDYPVGTMGPGTHRLYVRDIYVGNLWEPTLLSYNLWAVDLDPDRVGVRNPKEVIDGIRNLWAYCTDRNLIKMWMKKSVLPSAEVALRFIEMNENLWVTYENKSIWQSVWTELFGPMSCLRTTEEMARRASHLGWKVVEASFGAWETLRNVVKRDRDVVEEDAAKKRVPISADLLTDTQQKHLALVYWLMEKLLYLYAADRSVRTEPKIVAYTVLDKAAEYTDGEIRIKQSTLDSEGDTIEILVHELAHSTSDDASDLTEEHVREMEYLTWLLWRLRERPKAWDLYDAMVKHGITPKFQPKGVRPKIRPVYPAKPGDMVKVVAGAFQGQWGRVTKVGMVEATGSFVASIRRAESTEEISVLVENLAPDEHAWLFLVGDVVRIVSTGEEAEVTDIIFRPDLGEAVATLHINRPPDYPFTQFSESELVYSRRGPLFPTAPKPFGTPQLLGPLTREGVVRGWVKKVRERRG